MATEEKKSDAKAPAGRFQIGPSIDKLLAIPPNLEGLTPLQASDCFIKSEEFYVERALRVAAEMEVRLRFHLKLKDPVLLEQEIAPVFLNLQQIYSFNKKLYQELLKLRLHGDIVNSVGQCMITHVPFFKLYAGYIKEYRKAQAFVDILLEKKKKFLRWLDLNELCAGYSLKTLLLAPVSRVPQYLVFLGAIVRSLDPQSPAALKLLQALTALSQVSDDIAYGLKDEVSRKLVVTIQVKIFGGDCNLISPHRSVVKHSDLKKMYNKSLFGGSSKVYLFILFNDCLLYGTRPGKLSSGSVKHVLPLIGMTIEDERDDEKKKVKNGFKINSNTKSFVCCAINGPTKQSWVKALQDQIKLYSASAGTLQKGQQAADAFERMLKSKAGSGEATQSSSSSGGSSGASSRPNASVSQNHTGGYQGSTTPIQKQSINVSQSSHMQPPPSSVSTSISPMSAAASHNASFSSAPPPPAMSSGAYGNPPPPAPPSSSSYGGSPSPAPPRPPPSFGGGGPPPPAPSNYGAPPPAPSNFGSPPPPGPSAPPPRPPPSFGGGAGGGPPPPPSGFSSGGGPPPPPSGYDSYHTSGGGGDGDSGYDDQGGDYGSVSDYAPEAPTLEYDIPVIGTSAPAPPPMAPPPSFASAPKVDLLSQIQAGKALKSTEPQWVQVWDANNNAYYYEHKTTGESVWEAPDNFVPAAGTGGGSKSSILPGASAGGVEDKLKATLDRYRQFVQDEEDDVECGDDEWD